MAEGDGADINVNYGLLHQFAVSGPDVTFTVPDFVTKDACAGTDMPGCEFFKTADTESTTNMMRSLTQARMLLYGVRQGTAKIAEHYRTSEDHAVQALNDVVVETGDPNRLASEMELAQLRNPAPVLPPDPRLPPGHN